MNAIFLQSLHRTRTILFHLIWLVGIAVFYRLIFLIPLPPQYIKRGIFLTDEFILLALGSLFLLTYQQQGWGVKYLRFGLILIAFTLPLLRLWETGESTWNIVLGLLPWADSTGYYSDANRLLEGGLFSSFSGRRPLFASLLAVFLKLSNQNLQVTLVIFTIINVLAVFLFVEEIHNEWGSVAAIAALYLTVIFDRPFVGTVLTEQFGYPVGLLAFVVLIRAVRTARLWLFAGGLMLLTYALLIRAGTFFVLPLLILFAIVFYAPRRQEYVKIAMILMMAIAIPFLSNAWLGSVVASPEAVEFANFADTLYGQAKGGVRWTQAAIDHPELTSMQEPERSQVLYRLAWQEIKNHPLGLVKGSLKALWDFIRPGGLSAFGFLTFGNQMVDFVFQSLAALLFLFGLWKLGIDTANASSRLMLVYWAGTFISIPFLPPIDAGIRPYAASIASVFVPVCAVFSLPLFRRVEKNHPESDALSPVFSFGLPLALLLFALIGAPWIQVTAKSANIPTAICSSDLSLLNFKTTQGSYILLSEDGQKTKVPTILLSDVHKSFDDFAYGEFASVFRKIKQPTEVTLVNDLSTGGAVWVIVPQPWNAAEGRIVSGCAKLILPKYAVWQIESIK